MVNKFLVTCLAIFMWASCLAQESRIDSVKKLLATAKQDTNQVITLVDLSWSLLNLGDYDTAYQYAEKGKKLALALNYPLGTASAFNNIGVIYWMQAKYPKALENLFAALKIYEDLGSKKGAGRAYNNIGLVYFNMGNYPAALKNSFASLKISESLGKKQAVAASYSNIGSIYEAQGNNTDALKSYMEVLKISEELSDQDGLAKAHQGAGNIYNNLKNYSDALSHHAAAIKMFEELGDSLRAAAEYNNIANTYSSMASNGVSLSERKELFQQALKNYFISLKIREAFDDREGVTTSLGNIGATYEDMGDHQEAEKYNLRALKLATEIGALERVKESQENLSKIYSATGRLKDALEAYKAFVVARDSLINEENTKKTVQAEMQYEFDKKEEAARLDQEKKDALVQANKKRHNMILFSISAFGLLVLAFAIYAYRSYLQKQKINVEITRQKQLIEEKQKEVLDSIHYAKRIQSALITSERYIHKNIERLRN